MKILVTGGAGYIGSVTTEMLLDAGHEVTVFDNFEKGHRSAIDPRANLEEGDLRNSTRIAEAMAVVNPDAVMHFAAYALVGESMEQPEIYFRNNLVGGLNLVDAMLASGCKKIVFSSTCATYGQPDRVPINYFCNAGIDSRLKKHFGLGGTDDEGLRQALQVDFRGIDPKYVGPKLHPDILERNVIADHWGMHRRWIEHGSGGYWDYCEFPLANASEEDIANWPMPSPDNFDYTPIIEESKQYEQYAVYVGGPGIADIINKCGMLRGTEHGLFNKPFDSNPHLL